MSKRGIVFEEGIYYHIFNRGIDKKVIFHDEEDVKYFLDRLIDFNNDKPIGGVRRQKFHKDKIGRGKASTLVEIVAYCLLPNHFHLVLKQVGEEGISKFMQRVCTGYAMYYNKKYKRNGSLFQGKFRAKRLDGIDALYRLSVYVNLNYKHHMINPHKETVVSGLDEYLGTKINKRICSKKEVGKIIDSIGGVMKYKKYAKIHSKIFIENKDIITASITFEELEE